MVGADGAYNATLGQGGEHDGNAHLLRDMRGEIDLVGTRKRRLQLEAEAAAALSVNGIGRLRRWHDYFASFSNERNLKMNEIDKGERQTTGPLFKDRSSPRPSS